MNNVNLGDALPGAVEFTLLYMILQRRKIRSGSSTSSIESGFYVINTIIHVAEVVISEARFRLRTTWPKVGYISLFGNHGKFSVRRCDTEGNVFPLCVKDKSYNFWAQIPLPIRTTIRGLNEWMPMPWTELSQLGLTSLQVHTILETERPFFYALTRQKRQENRREFDKFLREQKDEQQRNLFLKDMETQNAITQIKKAAVEQLLKRKRTPKSCCCSRELLDFEAKTDEAMQFMQQGPRTDWPTTCCCIAKIMAGTITVLCIIIFAVHMGVGHLGASSTKTTITELNTHLHDKYELKVKTDHIDGEIKSRDEKNIKKFHSEMFADDAKKDTIETSKLKDADRVKKRKREAQQAEIKELEDAAELEAKKFDRDWKKAEDQRMKDAKREQQIRNAEIRKRQDLKAERDRTRQDLKAERDRTKLELEAEKQKLEKEKREANMDLEQRQAEHDAKVKKDKEKAYVTAQEELLALRRKQNKEDEEKKKHDLEIAKETARLRIEAEKAEVDAQGSNMRSWGWFLSKCLMTVLMAVLTIWVVMRMFGVKFQ